MSVIVEFHGRQSNNIFQYALGRIIHEKTGWALKTWNGNKDLRAKFGIPIDFGMPAFENQEHFQNCPPFINGIDLPDPVTITESDYASVDEIIKAGKGRGVHLHGFFQRSKYYIPHLEKIRRWFKLENLPRVEPEAWVFHVRRGDYLISGQELPIEYYEKVLLDHVPIDSDITFVGDCEPAFAQKLIALWEGARHICGNSITDMRFIAAHSNIVIANSTFSWWAAVLSDAKNIVMPRPAKGKYWCAGSDQDLAMPGWIIMDC